MSMPDTGYSPNGPSSAGSPAAGLALRSVVKPRRGAANLAISDDDLDRERTDDARISAYARLDFDNYTFFVQTLQVVLGRKSNHDMLLGSRHAVDVHLSSKKAISRRHAKIFYNFGTQRFELLILGRNGAFVNKSFLEKGITVPLSDSSKIQIGDIMFKFVLPRIDSRSNKAPGTSTPFNPMDAVNLRANLYNSKNSDLAKSRPRKKTAETSDTGALARRESVAGKSSAAARRKSLASAANDEIKGILEELGVTSIDAIGEDTELLDTPIQSILNRGTHSRHSYEQAIEDEEDEIDRLASQHNTSQGVSIDLDIDKQVRHLDMELAMIDQDLSALGTDSASESQRRSLQQERAHKQQDRNSLLIRKTGAFSRVDNLDEETRKRIFDHALIDPSFRGQKQGQGLMGKLASIQPPASRVYGRPAGTELDPKLENYFENAPYSLSTPRIPAPKLQVPILNMIPDTPTVRPRPPLRAITVSTKRDLSTFMVPKTIDEPPKYPYEPKRRRDNSLRMPKRVYSLEEIPDQYKIRPNYSQTLLVMSALKSKPLERGLTLSEIYETLKAIHPFFFYCPEGWQFGISHQVRFNKMFKRKEKFNGEWTYVVDELYISEREQMRIKQQEIAAQRARDAAARAEEYKQRTQMSYSQLGAHSYMGRPYSTPLGLGAPGSTQQTGGARSSWPTSYNASGPARPKTIAELASEIKRDNTRPHNAGDALPNTIKEQLAANRAQAALSQSPPSSSASPAPQPQQMNQSTKASLTYLQKELFKLYKARKLSYNTAITTDIITKALATTIAQVNVIGARAGCGENALSFLVERVPHQVSKILDIALTKSINERADAKVSPVQSPPPPPPPGPVTATPSPAAQSPVALASSPSKVPSTMTETSNPATSENMSGASPSRPSNGPSQASGTPLETSGKSSPTTTIPPPRNGPTPKNTASPLQASIGDVNPGTETPIATSGPGTPAAAAGAPSPPSHIPTKAPTILTSALNMVRPPSFKGNSLGRPAAFGSGTKPLYGKSGLSRPPTFLSNKPLRPSSGEPGKREATEQAESEHVKSARTQ